MKCHRNIIEELSEADIIELSRSTLNEIILVIRNISFSLLPKNNPIANVHEFYIRMLIDLSDIIHNIPNYLKHNNIQGLKSELICTLDFFDEKLFTHPFLIHELSALSLINIYMKKSLVTE